MGNRLNKKKPGTKTSKFGTTSRINHDSSSFYNTSLYSDLKPNNITNSEENTIPSEYLDKLICRSSEDMVQIPDNSVHLMITSPPYNVSKVYDGNLSLKEYLDLLRKVFKETYRVLTDGGRACINIANVGRKPYIPLSDNISKIMIDLGFNMRGEIIWNKGAGSGTSMAWGSWQSASNPVLRDVHEYILIFSKGSFKRIKKDKKNTIEKNQFMEWTKSVWNFNPESAKKVEHPAPFPEELPFRLIQLYSFEKDIILDPFIGSGTTALVALKSNRHYIGYDINEDYIKNAKKRLSPIKSQKKLML
ncbi:MAG: site-specific DNA-methyltransferase [Bacteroidales bacterium]